MEYYVVYQVPALKGEEWLEAGPWGSGAEARLQMEDIRGFEGVQNVKLVERFPRSTKVYNGEDMIGG